MSNLAHEEWCDAAGCDCGLEGRQAQAEIDRLNALNAHLMKNARIDQTNLLSLESSERELDAEVDALRAAATRLLLRLHHSHSINDRVDACDYKSCVEERAALAVLIPPKGPPCP